MSVFAITNVTLVKAYQHKKLACLTAATMNLQLAVLNFYALKRNQISSELRQETRSTHQRVHALSPTRATAEIHVYLYSKQVSQTKKHTVPR